MEDEAPLKAPEGLGPAGIELWDSVVKDYDLNGAGQRLLFDAATQADVIDELYSSWLAEGMPKTTRGSRNQLVSHPTIGDISQAKNTLRQLIGALKLAPLDDDPADTGSIFTEGPVNRPRTRAEVGRMGAAKRWGNHYGL